MRKWMIGFALLGTTLVAGVGPLSAQAWDAPMFLPPQPGEDIGVYFVKPDGTDWGLSGIWRQEGQLNLGLELGIGGVEHRGGEANHTFVTVGGETWGSLLRSPTAPVDVDWVLGVGAGFFSDFTLVRIPFGVTIGKTLPGDGLSITPYVLPRIALDVASVGNVTNTDLDFAADLGADLRFTSGVKLRFAATLGDPDSFGIGLAFPFGRRVEVH